MATIPTVAVTVRAYDQQGDPIEGANVTAKLQCIERYHGWIVPSVCTATTDADGIAVLDVFPNELGTEGSEYLFKISSLQKTVRVYASVPNTNCNLSDISELDRYECRGAGQILDTDIVFEGDTQVARVEAEGDTQVAAVQSAKDGIDEALSDAQDAQSGAEAAQTRAETAQGLSEAAATASQTAQHGAEDAEAVAITKAATATTQAATATTQAATATTQAATATERANYTKEQASDAATKAAEANSYATEAAGYKDEAKTSATTASNAVSSVATMVEYIPDIRTGTDEDPDTTGWVVGIRSQSGQEWYDPSIAMFHKSEYLLAISRAKMNGYSGGRQNANL
ncbi:MAG: hypothetical protein M0P33_00005, partial [Massilibacteroides sp.]|nr:hypothetical protein [Massilibacteroides sp.]